MHRLFKQHPFKSDEEAVEFLRSSPLGDALGKRRTPKMEKLNTKTDVSIGKSVYMNGKKLGMCQHISFDYDATDIPTKVNLTLHVLRESVKINGDKIEFETEVCG